MINRGEALQALLRRYAVTPITLRALLTPLGGVTRNGGTTVIQFPPVRNAQPKEFGVGLVVYASSYPGRPRHGHAGAPLFTSHEFKSGPLQGTAALAVAARHGEGGMNNSRALGARTARWQFFHAAIMDERFCGFEALR